MTSGQLPEYFINFVEKRNIDILFNEDEKQVVKDASEKLDYLAFSYYL